MMDLIENRAKLKELYQPSQDRFSLVDVPELPFAIIDGEGAPDENAAKAVKALFTAIYPIRREARERLGKRFVEPPLEMVYWADDMADLAAGRKERWKWQVLVTLPIWADEAVFHSAVQSVKSRLEEIPDTLRREVLTEGRCAQILHVGTPEEIPAKLEELYTRFLPEHGLQPAGRYHEIYLDDWSRVAPQRRKIVLRQPVQEAT